MAQVYPEPPVTQSSMDVQAGAVPVAVPIDPTNGAPIAAVPAFTNSMDMTAMFAHDAISVQQTRRGCFQEMCGCEAKSEYREPESMRALARPEVEKGRMVQSSEAAPGSSVASENGT